MVAMLRPLQPMVEYAINYDYISKVLCINKDKPELSCNGKCQLMEKLEKQQDEDYKSIRILIEEYPIGFVEVLEVVSNLNMHSYQEKANYGYLSNYSYLFLDSVFHPPAV